MAGVDIERRTRRLIDIALGCVVLALTGCGDGYPKSLTYPLRTDLLVLKPPTDEPAFPDSPGQLDRSIALITKLGRTLNPREVPAKDQQEIRKELARVFGSPAAPKVAVSDTDDTESAEAVTELALDSKSLAQGSRLYRRHCLHCHGLTGD